MSLSVDGVWAAGVWNTTVWADGVWREGGAPVSDNPRYQPLVAPADWADPDFEEWARLLDMQDAVEDLDRFISEVEAAGDEYVDPFEMDPALSGRGRRGR